MAGRVKSRWRKKPGSILGFLAAFSRNLFYQLKRRPLLHVLVLLLFLFSLTIPVYGFVRLPPKERMTVRVLGTKNFGEQVIFDKEVEVRVGATAGEALEQAVEIDLSGSYIETIEGIKGNQTEYWFYYINGVMANVFAHGYKLYPGDVQHWDFHDWTSYVMGPSAMLGQFPEPCLHGYNGKIVPTIVVYTEGFRDYALRLKKKLAALGVQEVVVKEAGFLTAEEKGKNNLFIIAPAGNKLIGELNKYYQERETIYFKDDKIIVRNRKGKPGKTYGPGYGMLQAIQNPWNPKGSLAHEGVVWAISGLDETGVKRAANVLINQSESLKCTFAVAVGKEKMIKAPVSPTGIKTLTVQTEEGILEKEQDKEANKEAFEKQAPSAGLKNQPKDTTVPETKPETKTMNENQKKTKEENSTVSKVLVEKAVKNNLAKDSSLAKKDIRLVDFWWLIPLVVVVGTGIWWTKKKRIS